MLVDRGQMEVSFALYISVGPFKILLDVYILVIRKKESIFT